LILGDIVFWLTTFLVLIISIVILVKRIWLPYSKFLVLLISFYMFINFLLLFSMPDWIKNIGCGIAFLVFPILDGITTDIALTKYDAKEANPIMAWVIKMLGIRVAMFIPFTFYLIFVLLFWEKTDSSILFGLTIGYIVVILNNVIVIHRNGKKLEMAKNSETNIT